MREIGLDKMDETNFVHISSAREAWGSGASFAGSIPGREAVLFRDDGPGF